MNGHEEKATLVGRVRRSDDGGVPVENVIVRPRPGAAGRRGILLEILLRVGNTRVVVVSRFARSWPRGDGRGEVRGAFPRRLETRHASPRLAIASFRATRGLPGKPPRRATRARSRRAPRRTACTRTWSSLVMRFEAIAGVRPSLGRAPVYATPFGSPPLESPRLARLEEASKKSAVGEGEACATRQAASRDEICARFQSQKKCGQKARQLRTVVAKCFAKLPPPALVPHSPPRASHQRKRPVDRVTPLALARKLSRDRLRIHPKRTTPCLVPPPPPCWWPSRSASPPPAFRRSTTSCTARGPPTPASSSGRSWT